MLPREVLERVARSTEPHDAISQFLREVNANAGLDAEKEIVGLHRADPERHAVDIVRIALRKSRAESKPVRRLLLGLDQFEEIVDQMRSELTREPGSGWQTLRSLLAGLFDEPSIIVAYTLESSRLGSLRQCGLPASMFDAFSIELNTGFAFLEKLITRPFGNDFDSRTKLLAHFATNTKEIDDRVATISIPTLHPYLC